MKPILFNTEMVQAILDGRKTVTRRLVKPQLYGNVIKTENVDPLGYLLYQTDEKYLGGYRNRKSQYAPGDILYVRETWCESRNKYYYKADKKCMGCDEMGTCLPKGTPVTPVCELCEYSFDSYKWHPSLHMPKEAARIFLRVTGVRAERLQDITEGQAINEGTPYELCGGWKPTFNNPDSGGPEPDFIKGFSKLWNSTIPVKPPEKLYQFGWKANPWVWVIEFERISKEDAYAEKL